MYRKVLFTMAIAMVTIGAHAQSPVLPTSGSWGTYGSSQLIHVPSDDGAFDVELRTRPEKKTVMACRYTTEITNKSGKTVSFTLYMVSPKGKTSSDDAKVKLGPGEKTEVSFTIGACKNSDEGGEDKKYNGCCTCSFGFEFKVKSVK